MQQNLNNDEIKEGLNKVRFLVGDAETVINMQDAPARAPFDVEVIDFLNKVSQFIMASPAAKAYPDVVTLAFWMRKSSVTKLKESYNICDGNIRVGRGVAFHIAPSNVPVNYAYSFVSGLLMGNANIVRIPSKDFPQIGIINKAINEALEAFNNMRDYVALVRYDRSTQINDVFSAMCDVRIIWGGDATIGELRKSPLGPRATEVTFADRYSLSVIDSDAYLEIDNKKKLAEDFYNDTYLTDQNACTSPRLIAWLGNSVLAAQEEFWSNLRTVVKGKYTFQSIMGINKLTSAYILAATHDDVELIKDTDNLIYRIKVKNADATLMEFKDNSGYFFECECKDIMELSDICNNTHCQTIGFLGRPEQIMPLITSGIKGVDRVVPIGKTMDFDLIWDGYNLYERLCRVISVGI